ncbi:ComF family protein [Lacticaseibacillus baoqingensis]|uniref:ComF family protein n=1 Tax=Lacticaseibacillus baoqingensis TaxID=2486013 RepID=A0ABW4E5J6_9LACO|nr:ComF family protein [Lacticaseibacillus baoqingensis]
MNWTLSQLFGRRPLQVPQLCAACLRTFAPIDAATACPGCGRQASPKLCFDCQRWQQQGPLLHHQGVFAYNAAMKAFIQRYKGLGDWRLHRAFQAQLIPSKRGVFVPLTSEPKHFASRGFDPVLGLFAHLPLRLWLQKADTPTPQAKKDRTGRLATPQSFTVRAGVVFGQAKRVILVDDLYTTGRTFYHAAAALQAAGFQGEITSFSLIR